MTVNVTFTANTTLASAEVVNIVRSDTGLPPIGVSFPIAMMNPAGNKWTCSFDDPGPSATYVAFCMLMLPDGSASGPFSFPVGSSPVTGFWTSQLLIEQFLGTFNADQLSNADNVSTSPSACGFQDAINRAQAVTDYELALFRYPNSLTSPQFPTSSFAFNILSERTTELAGAWVYIKRGVWEQNDGIAGKFKKLQADAKCEIGKIVRNGIYDVSRQGISKYPSIVLNPALVGYGGSNSVILPANVIPEIP